MTIYADEDFYKNNYLCGKNAVIDTAFSFYARSATQKIKLYTCDNIDESDIPECVKMCCCELAERLYSYEQSDNNGVSSESVGGWSKSYESASNKQRNLKADIREIVYKWLSGTGLLYRGLR